MRSAGFGLALRVALVHQAEQLDDKAMHPRLAPGEFHQPVATLVCAELERLVEQCRDVPCLVRIEALELHAGAVVDAPAQASAMSWCRKARAFAHSRSTVRVEVPRTWATSRIDRPAK